MILELHMTRPVSGVGASSRLKRSLMRPKWLLRLSMDRFFPSLSLCQRSMLFVSDSFILRHGIGLVLDVPWEECPWLGWIDPVAEWSINETFRKRYGGRCVLRMNDLWSMTEAARAGVGVMVHGCGTPLVTRGLVHA